MSTRAIAVTTTHTNSASGSAARCAASPPRSAVRCAAAPRSSRSLATSRPSTGWAAITSKAATATASTPCAPLPATTSVCSCAGSSGFCAPWCECCSPSLCASKPPKAPSTVLHGRHRNPARLVAEIATADALSNGRLMLGIGAGYQPYEFERFGVDIKANLEMTEEFCEILDRAFSQDFFSYDGKHYQIPRPTSRLNRCRNRYRSTS